MTKSATSFLTEKDKVISVEAAAPLDLRKLARECSSAAGTSGAPAVAAATRQQRPPAWGWAGRVSISEDASGWLAQSSAAQRT